MKSENKDYRISRVNWNHLKNVQKIPEQHTWKAQHRGIMYITLLGTAQLLGNGVT